MVLYQEDQEILDNKTTQRMLARILRRLGKKVNTRIQVKKGEKIVSTRKNKFFTELEVLLVSVGAREKKKKKGRRNGFQSDFPPKTMARENLRLLLNWYKKMTPREFRRKCTEVLRENEVISISAEEEKIIISGLSQAMRQIETQEKEELRRLFEGTDIKIK